jgi:hypothetical protein
MRFMEHPRTKVKRGYGVKTEVHSISLNKTVAALLEEFLEEEQLGKSYFVQECIKKGLDRYKESGFVYLIKWGQKDFEGNTTIKIGRTKNPQERLQALAGGSGGAALPVTLEMFHLIECHHAKKVETMLHKNFSKKRIEQTEYFNLTDEDLKWFLNEEYREIKGINQYLDF